MSYTRMLKLQMKQIKEEFVATNLPFIQRYFTATMTLLDHYRHLLELLAIYQALEKKLSEIHLPSHIKSILFRANLIKQDLAFLDQKVRYLLVDPIIASLIAHTYAETINKMYSFLEGRDQLFMHCLVRILTDMSACNRFQKTLRKLYSHQKLSGLDDPKAGIRFYDFTEDDKKQIQVWLDQFTWREERNIKRFGVEARDWHAEIYNNLNKTPGFAWDVNSTTLFCAAATVVGAVATGISYAIYQRFNNP